MHSILFNTDSYKVSMHKQYPEGTEHVYSYITARGGIYNKVMALGVQPALHELSIPFTLEDIHLANAMWTAHGEPFPLEGWLYIWETYKGKLPLTIRALPEGTLVPTGTVIATVMNTDPKVPWLTTWVETMLLRKIWYMSSVATLSFHIKGTIKEYLELSGDVSSLPFKLHDFGARGTSSYESASSGGAAHLVNFMGTDTFSGIVYAVEHYNADPMATGFSIPAAEHSTITSWGRGNEGEAFANMVSKFGGEGKIYAVVSDSYDIFKACKMWASGDLKAKVLAAGGTLVVRPDSGDPVQVLSRCMDILAEGYGFTVNAKGYKVLNNVRMIWGDGINHHGITKILHGMVRMQGWSADNFAFGMGGALLNGMRRDDLGWAMKASAVCINGKYTGISKNPITATNKKSLSGLVVADRNADGKWYNRVMDWKHDEMQDVFNNGEYLNVTTFQEIRDRAAKQ